MIRVSLVQDKKRKSRETTKAWMNIPITFSLISLEDVSDEPLIVEAKVEGYLCLPSGMREGKFLGYMVTSDEIRANPKNTKDLADLQSPRTLKEMQSLSGKLAALNRGRLKQRKPSSKMKKLFGSTIVRPCHLKETYTQYLAVTKEAESVCPSLPIRMEGSRPWKISLEAPKVEVTEIPIFDPEVAIQKEMIWRSGLDSLTKPPIRRGQDKRSTEYEEINTIVEEEEDKWMTPIIRCLEEGVWPKDKNESRCLRTKINQYTLEDGVLFKKGYLVPMLRCVGPLQANYVIREIHMGSCGMHSGPHAVIRKAIRHGYYWPIMHEDAKQEVQKCDACQIHSPVSRLPKTLMTSIMAPWPFYQWGMDILEPLSPTRGGAKFVIVAIDYFTKWI
ncbi:reverse transcriptase domain-containing protein [Tanacetum coccineum]